MIDSLFSYGARTISLNFFEEFIVAPVSCLRVYQRIHVNIALYITCNVIH